MNTNEGLKREIGVLGLSANIVNLIVGAGIFVIPAIVAERLGAASILAYLFCGFLIMLIMLCFAEVGSKLTQSGGAYSYIEVAFGKYFGFLTVNFFILGATIMADAAVANALAGTLAYFMPVFNNEIVGRGKYQRCETGNFRGYCNHHCKIDPLALFSANWINKSIHFKSGMGFCAVNQ